MLGRLDADRDYVPVRLGDLNTQTRWVLERADVPEPDFLAHVMLRVRDVMRERFPLACDDEPVRRVGRQMAREDVDLVPIVNPDGELAGVMTERALARRYIRESREASRLDAPAKVSAIVEVLGGRLVAGEDCEISGRVWVMAMEIGALPSEIRAGDVAVVGNREDAQLAAIELDVGLLVLSNGTEPSQAVLDAAGEHGTAVVCSPLDTYVTGRMITLSAPCRALMDPEPLTVRPDDLLSDVADEVKDVHYRAAVAIDPRRRPIGLVTRSDLVRPRPRQVILVDHAEEGQSVPGVGQAEIVEILDHHHIGSIETKVPVRATFDPVGSTATLVVERFRQNGLEPSRPTATALLGAVLSDTVILNSPTATERDRAVVAYLEFGREMFESTSDLSHVAAEEIVSRDAKVYEAGGGHTLCIAQVETVGHSLDERREERLDALEAVRERRDYALYALMVTDILARDTDLYVSGDTGPLEQAFGEPVKDGVLALPGVMSRKKQVAPKVLEAF
jgi:manganese-dependent inorganic pyrophosphatase